MNNSETTCQSINLTPDCYPAGSDPGIAVISRNTVFENTVFSVYADHIADLNGHQVERYLSVEPRCLLPNAMAGVAVLPVCDGKFGLIRVYRHPLECWSWEVIKGHVESGEDIKFSAVRELLEEAGYLIDAQALIDLGGVTPEAGVIKARTRLFAALVSGTPAITVQRELGHGQMAFFDRAEIYDLIDQGEIEDASTLVILFKYLFNPIRG